MTRARINSDVKTDDRGTLERLTYRIEDIANVCGVPRRLIEAERAAGQLPRPEKQIGRISLWLVETIKA
jgi:hypothetical protein